MKKLIQKLFGIDKIISQQDEQIRLLRDIAKKLSEVVYNQKRI